MAGPRTNLRIIAVVVLCMLLLFGSIGGSAAVALYAFHQSQHNWCTALTILTRHPEPAPADPARNPSRVATYQFYVSLKGLEHHFGC